MTKEILTFGKWYNLHPEFSTIFDKVPSTLLNSLYPDTAITWMGSQSPAISVSTCVFEEALHKYSERFVYVPHLKDLDNSGQIMRIQADIMYQSLSEWNKWIALKDFLNSELSEDKLFKLLGNYSLTKQGGWTDEHKSEKFTDNSTYARDTGNTVSIANFETTSKQISATTINTIPTSTTSEPSLQFQHIPGSDVGDPAKSTRNFDGGGSTTHTDYKEFGQRMGDVWSKYKDLIYHFPNAVDLFLVSTAQAYLTDVYDANMWCHILSDEL